jgi:hypothetical protein
MVQTKDNTYLSKSLFLRGIQCHKSLYLHKHHPELRDEITDELDALFQAGFEVGRYAQQLFPCGVEIPYEEKNYAGQVEKTEAEIAKGTKTIYEAAFSFDNVFVKVDILRRGQEGWEIYEVKSSVEVKDVYINDIAVQCYVLTGAGLPVNKASLVHINNQYVRHGDIEVQKLFTVQDVTEMIIGKQTFVKEEVSKMKAMLKGPMPDIDIGKQCNDPYACDFKGHCWQHIPENSVFNLAGKGVNRFDLYRQGIIRLEDIPLDILNKKQRMQVEAFLHQKEFIDKSGVKAFFDSLWYPIYFLDFETFYVAIPPFDGVTPYQHVPFQFSIHCLENENAELRHIEYLARPNIDHRKELLVKLLDSIPENACVIAWSSSFEIMVLKYLAGWFPEYKERIDGLISNVRDIAGPFKQRDIYSWKMNGSFSLKTVLPVFVPELSYDGLDISHGGMAMAAYFDMCESQDFIEIERIRKALLEYCKLDTLAMVRILEKVKGLSA